MSGEKEAVKEVEFLGSEDVTCWFEEMNNGVPLIFPLWPDDFPEHLAVYMSAEGDLGVALTRAAMLSARNPERLWFCRIPKEDFLSVTNADPAWFRSEPDATSN